MSDRWSVFDLVEAFQLAHAVDALHQLELFEALKEPITPADLAANHGLDPSQLRGILEYVADRTGLLRKRGDRFVTTSEYSGESRFLLDLYAGAYSGNAALLRELLSDASGASHAIDRIRYAQAFAAVDSMTPGVLPELIRQLEFSHVLDLGCGSGALLLELARQDSRFVGWGMDFNRAMCKVARMRIRSAGVGKRVRVIEGDCRDPGSALTAKVSAMVGAVTVCNLANEMFGEGHSRAITWLRALRKTFPGRPLLIADYYGRLGHKNKRRSRETLLHDYVQLISGQGVPPSGVTEWRSIYARAKCRLVHVIEDRSTTRFVHILRL